MPGAHSNARHRNGVAGMNFLHSPSHRPHQGRGRRQPEVVGFTIRLTNGTRITRRYVDQALPDTAENRELHVFMNRVEASEFVRKRREQCQAEHHRCRADLQAELERRVHRLPTSVLCGGHGQVPSPDLDVGR